MLPIFQLLTTVTTTVTVKSDASAVQGGLPEPQNNTIVKELSEIRPLINKTKASDAQTKVYNCDCTYICIDEINTPDGKLDLSISEFKLSAEISQNALEIDSLKAKQKDLEVKIQQQEEIIHKFNPENSDFKFKFESFENLILRLTHNNQENNDCGLVINEIRISRVGAPTNNALLNKSNKSNITLANSDSLFLRKSPVSLNKNTQSLSALSQMYIALSQMP